MVKQTGLSILLLMVSGAVFAETAQEAWNRNVADILKKRAPESFRYVENNSNLPNVFIYGDSISIGYTPAVRKNMDGVANVYRLNRNGDWSQRVIPFIDELETAMRNLELSNPWNFQWDVMVFNTGMHDLKYLNGRKLDTANGKPQCSLDQYSANLKKNVEWLRQKYPQTQLVFVTTTPVPNGAEGRVSGDAAKYNQAARNVLKAYPEVAVADLYSISKQNQADWCKKPGDVHYNLAGSAAQGEWLAQFIEPLFKK